MTREEYTFKEIEELLNGIILPIMNKSKDQYNRNEFLNKISFLYSVDRINKYQLLLIIGRALTNEEWDKVQNEFRNNGYMNITSKQF